jgi:hypothetical protein
VPGELSIRVEAHSVVRYLKAQRALIAHQLQPHAVRPGVLDGVVQRLLGDAVDGFLNLRRGTRLVAERGRDLYLVASPQGRGLLLERRHEPLRL